MKFIVKSYEAIRKAKETAVTVEGHLQPSPSRASLLMGKGLETDITETVNKSST